MSEAIKVRIGGGWKKKDPKGNVTRIEIPLTATSKLIMFPNDRKEGNSDPDVVLYLYAVQKESKREESSQHDDPL